MGPLYAGSDMSFDTFDLKNASSGAVRAGWVAYAIDHNATITHAGYRQGTTTGTPASGSYKIGLYTVDGSGLPTATDLGGGSPTEVTFQPSSADDGKIVWVALTNSVQIARGTVFSVVLQNNANTSANGITVAYRASNLGMMVNSGSPYELTYSGGSWTKGSSGFRQPVFCWKSSSQVYGFPFQSSGASSTTSTSGNRVALKFTLDAAWGDTFKLAGFRGVFRTGVAGGSYGVGLWDSSGTLLAGANTYDTDQVRSTGNNAINEFSFADTTLPTLTFGTTYYIGVESVSSSTVGSYLVNFTNANDMLALPLGSNACYSTWNGSAWSDITTSRPLVDLIFDDITEPTGSGGGAFPANLSGGIFQ